LSEADDVDEIDAPEGPRRPPLTPAQRRARRQTITLLIVGGLLLVSFLFAAAYYGGWFDEPKPTSGAKPCTPTATSTVKPSQVKLNVYNASTRNGLARKVAGEMKDRGFAVGSIANDPLHRSVKTTAEIRYGTKGKAGAQLVMAEVPGAKLVADKRKDASIDLVLGPSYAQLTPTDTPTSTATCTPTGTTTGTGTATPSGTKTSNAAATAAGA
jgi:LytR cell envelope-related transcriptional attenuator